MHKRVTGTRSSTRCARRYRAIPRRLYTRRVIANDSYNPQSFKYSFGRPRLARNTGLRIKSGFTGADPRQNPKAGATTLVAPDSREAAATGHLLSAPVSVRTQAPRNRTPADAPRDAAEPEKRGFYIEIGPLDTSSEGDYFQTSTHREKTRELKSILFDRLPL